MQTTANFSCRACVSFLTRPQGPFRRGNHLAEIVPHLLAAFRRSIWTWAAATFTSVIGGPGSTCCRAPRVSADDPIDAGLRHDLARLGVPRHPVLQVT